MSSFDKLMGDIYESFNNEQDQDKSSENEHDRISTDVMENQVALEDVFDNTDPTSSKLESPTQENEESNTEPTIPLSDVAAAPSQETNTEEVIVSVSKDGQYSLFGDDDFTVTSDQEKGNEVGCGATSSRATTSGKKSGKVDSKSSNPSPRSKPKGEIKVTAEWSLHYSAQTFRVGGEGGIFPEMTDTDEKTLEEVRQKMEEDFFEFTKSRVKWDYDKDLKRLYPDVFGTSKGGV